MGQTKEGAAKARLTNLAKNPNYYKELASSGGRVKGVKKGFAQDPKRAVEAGIKGREMRELNKAKNNGGHKDEFEQETATSL